MILAAGRGTRLGELGRRIPKALVDVGGQPLLARQLDYLAAEGVQRVVVNAHHLAEQIVDFLASRTAAPETIVSLEPELLGTAGGVRAAIGEFDQCSPIIVVHADTILDARLRPIVAAHRRARAQGTICVNWVSDSHGKGVVEVGPDGEEIVAFIEKPADRRPGLVNAGLYVLERSVVEIGAPGEFCDFASDVFPRMLADGRRLRAHSLDTTAHDIGTPQSLETARRLLTIDPPAAA